jgi:hypothetical protein
MNSNQEHAMWMEIVQRLQAGEMQSEVARAYGMSRGKFRYRLARFLETSGIGELKIPAEATAQAQAARAELAAAQAQIAAAAEGAPPAVGAAAKVDTPSAVEAPAKAESSATAERPAPVAVKPSALQMQLNLPLVDPTLRDASLVDESWHRNHGLNRLVAMVKEPRTLFAYWELNDSRKQLVQEHFRADWNQLPFYLVVHDVTDLHFNGTNAHDTIRIQVHPRAESWYVHGVAPGRRYQIDFCTQTLGGQLFTLLRSNIVETPPLPQDGAQEPRLKFGTIHQETPEYLRAHDAQLVPATLQDEPWHDQFTGYNLTEGNTSGEGDKH